MKVIFLGTNGWYDTETGNTTCILIETDKEFIILDAGNGFYKIDKYIKSKKPIYLFLSHYHLDHISGLHILNKFNFSQGIKIYGPPNLKKAINTIIKQPYSMPLKQLKTDITLYNIDKKIKFPVNVEYKELSHTALCYGYRFYLENKVISYCPDTAMCDNLFLLAKNAGLLITECSYKVNKDVKSWPHLNPQKAAYLAKKSNAKKLLLVHFDPNIYKTLKERKEAQIIASKVFKNTVAASDNLSVKI
ncbi:MAG: hypothetical protein A2539_10310 [Elusimicrobia bacterium RIFOXYD2_FULL_34_15]|nr:MAG: hypothetical protein A2539_10310 [Elusimicrobia bacterium RIFOXYD2_FULL_34_15]